MTTTHLSLRLSNIKHHLYHVPCNPKHYSIIFAIILQFDKAMFLECQFQREDGKNDDMSGTEDSVVNISTQRSINFQFNLEIMVTLEE